MARYYEVERALTGLVSQVGPPLEPSHRLLGMKFKQFHSKDKALSTYTLRCRVQGRGMFAVLSKIRPLPKKAMQSTRTEMTGGKGICEIGTDV